MGRAALVAAEESVSNGTYVRVRCEKCGARLWLPFERVGFRDWKGLGVVAMLEGTWSQKHSYERMACPFHPGERYFLHLDEDTYPPKEGNKPLVSRSKYLKARARGAAM